MDTKVDGYRFSGYRIIEFSPASRQILKEIAEKLAPYEEKILNNWMAYQYRAWQPPSLKMEEVRRTFGNLLHNILNGMSNYQLEKCILELENTGINLAINQFPFEALIISIHFLEESYMPFLVNPPSKKTQRMLIAMDEFLHAALAALATSYFKSYRKDILDQAEVGRIVQESLLADIPQKIADLDVSHVYLSAQESAQIGGDFLDYFEIDSGQEAFILGDLSGHGIEAAADSVMVRSLFRGFMRENPDLCDAMGRLNKVLCAELDSDQFATAVAIIYGLNGEMQIVSAGHPYPVFCKDGKCDQLKIDGMALGIIKDIKYCSTHITLNTGDMIATFTDGLPEARVGNSMFENSGVLSAISEMSDAHARAIVEHTIDKALRHAGGKFADDVAMLVLKRTSDEIGKNNGHR